ncbi:MAG: NAD-dependent epimerase/dehydratase family protein [Candidatus Brocadiae bacterium]|nr:NAD-dependent epimerase/dehydratase family protein [Candidatus Brocadiia bacterium]
MQKILITGMAGGLANVIAESLKENYEIIGVDTRPYRKRWVYHGKFLQVNYTRREFGDIFREYKPEIVLHLGRISGAQEKLYQRHNFNVMGTNNILNLCSKHEVRTVVILSTFHVYGAHQHNPAGITEDHPLRAGQIFPEIIDAVELDHLATSYFWKNRSAQTVVLRPCNIVGKNLNNTISRFLRLKFIPHLMGFDPMLQFIYESDFVQAINLILKQPSIAGVYNLVGSGSLPLKEAVKVLGATSIPVSHYLAYPALKILSVAGIGFPPHLMDYFRYPVILSHQKFCEASGYNPQVGLLDTLRGILE